MGVGWGTLLTVNNVHTRTLGKKRRGCMSAAMCIHTGSITTYTALSVKQQYNT